jgi:hypothetical protein
VQNARAVPEHGRTRVASEEAAAVDFVNVADEVDFDATRLTGHIREPGEEVVVRQ